jgi:hypothetical protein
MRSRLEAATEAAMPAAPVAEMPTADNQASGWRQNLFGKAAQRGGR